MSPCRSLAPGVRHPAPVRPSAPTALSAALALAFGAGLAFHTPARAVPVTLGPSNLTALALTGGGGTSLDCSAASVPGSSPAQATCLPSGNFYLLPSAQSSSRAGVDWGLQVAGQARGSEVTSTARIQTGFTNSTTDTLRFGYRYLIGAGSLELGTGIGGLENVSGIMQARASLLSRITVAGIGATSVEGEVGIVFSSTDPDSVTRTGAFTGLNGVSVSPSSVSWSDTVFSLPGLLDLLPGQSFTLTHDFVGFARATADGFCCSGTRCSATYSGAQASLGNIANYALGLTYEKITGGDPGGGGNPVVLPGTLLLGAAGLAGMGAVRRRRR